MKKRNPITSRLLEVSLSDKKFKEYLIDLESKYESATLFTCVEEAFKIKHPLYRFTCSQGVIVGWCKTKDCSSEFKRWIEDLKKHVSVTLEAYIEGVISLEDIEDINEMIITGLRDKLKEIDATVTFTNG